MYWILIVICLAIISSLLFILIRERKEQTHWRWKATELERLYTAASIRYDIASRLSQNGSLLNNIKSRDIKRLYIYGGGVIGHQLYLLLQGTPNLHILGIIDREFISSTKFDDLPTYTMDDLNGKFDETDWVIMTPIFAYDKILPTLLSHMNAEHIITLDELLID